MTEQGVAGSATRSQWLTRVQAASGLGFATRVMPSGTAELSYLAYSVLNWPAFMIPYYLVFGLAGAVHLSLGVAAAVQILWSKRVRGSIARPVGATAAIVLGLAVLSGVVTMAASAPEVDHARFAEYRALYEEYLPFMRPK